MHHASSSKPTYRHQGPNAELHYLQPVIDYSKFFTILRQRHWYAVELEPFIRLIKILDEMRVNEIEQEHTVETEYTDCVGRGIHLHLLHYNSNRVTEMSLCIVWSGYYLPYANTLSRPCVLYFERKDNLTEEHVDGAVQFVRMVQQAFPGSALIPKFTSWIVPYVGQTQETFYSPQIKLLGVFDRLHDIAVPCFTPRFLLLVTDIDTNQLRSLQD
ncbi:hypothetical protein BGZ82_003338 [Podila clonocystis]|nr:hypothetical protein BGZ82_003338 [Podila clonocystis]